MGAVLLVAAVVPTLIGFTNRQANASMSRLQVEPFIDAMVRDRVGSHEVPVPGEAQLATD